MAASAIKGAVKGAVKGAFTLAGRIFPGPTDAARILTYHSVGHRRHEMNVTPEAFRAQMAWLAANQNVIPLREAAEGLPGVAITFDDGYRDNLEIAAPVLTEFALPATVFMVAGRAGDLLDHDDDAVTSTLMTWDEVRRLDDMGVTIGAHTLTHPHLAYLDDDEQREEIIGSVTRLGEELGHPIEAFAYPYGTARDYNDMSIRLVQESGCALAVSNRYGANRPGADRWAIRRIWIDETDSLTSFQAKVTGRLDIMAALESPVGLFARRILNVAARGE